MLKPLVTKSKEEILKEFRKKLEPLIKKKMTVEHLKKLNKEGKL